MNVKSLLASLTLTALAGGLALGQAPAARPPEAPIGVITAPTLEQAKAETWSWLQAAKADPAACQKAEALWQPGEATLLDRVVGTFVLADAEAARLVAFIPTAPGSAIKEVPAALKDPARPVFYRANLGMYFAKVAVDRKLFEEGYETLKVLRPEQMVDPASYYFYKAVCENKLRKKADGLLSIHRLLNSVPNTPERYTVVAQLMKEEMDRWQDDDLGDIARRMDEITGRLDNARGGPKTQKKQQEVIALLDKTIEDIEKQCQQCQGGGGQSQNNQPQKPADDSTITGGMGKGHVDPKRLMKDPAQWGKMPEKDKLKALEAINRSLPPHMREAGEGYRNNVTKGMRGNSN
jgi:hypothetical protein